MSFLLAIPVLVIVLWLRELIIRGITGEPPQNSVIGFITQVSTWSAVLAGLVYLCALVCAYWQARQAKRMRTLVPACNGAVCPRCVRPLVRHRDGLKGRCPDCDHEFELDLVTQYWSERYLDPLRSLDTRSRLLPESRNWRGRRRRFVKAIFAPTITRQRDVALRMAIIIGLYVLFMTLVFRRSVYSNLLQASQLMLPLVGVGVLVTEWKRKKGAAQRCAECGYQCAPEGEQSSRCPECGSDWADGGGRISGTPDRRPLVFVAGIFMIAFGLVLYFSAFRNGAALRALQPTRSLIHDITTPNTGFTMDQWAALNARTLSREEEIKLAEKLLAYRDAGNFLDSNARTWITKQLNAENLPDELQRKWYEGLIEFDLVAPETVRVGKPFTVTLDSIARSTIHSTGPGKLQEEVYIEGFYIGDANESVGRREIPRPLNLVGRNKYSSNEEYIPKTTITPDQPGPLPIRFVLWSVVAPGIPTSPGIKWNDDGSPQIPPNALWVKRMERKTVVNIVE